MPPRVEIALPRVAWLLFLASTLVLFAFPAAILAQLAPSGPSFGSLRPDLATHPLGEWSWDWEVWLVPLLAAVAPAVVHALWQRRAAPPYRVVRRLSQTSTYRDAPHFHVELEPRMARRWSAAYLLRLTIVASLCAIPWVVLTSTRFVESFGCLGHAHVRTVPEHLAFSALLVLTLLFHWPTGARMFGRPPRVTSRGSRA